jgi:hypothetical protein
MPKFLETRVVALSFFDAFAGLERATTPREYFRQS